MAGAKRAIEAGFQIIELHFAYGGFVASFLSPFSNHRTDEYGGSFEARIRLAIEVTQSVKSAIPSGCPLFVRLCCTDNLPPGDIGWDVEQSIELCKRRKALGVALVDCSTGGNDGRAVPAFVDQVPLTVRIQRECNIATCASGGIVNPKWAEQIVRQRKATLVLIGRVSLDDSNWPLHAANQLNAKLEINHSYGWAIGPDWRQTTLANQNDADLVVDPL